MKNSVCIRYRASAPFRSVGRNLKNPAEVKHALMEYGDSLMITSDPALLAGIVVSMPPGTAKRKLLIPNKIGSYARRRVLELYFKSIVASDEGVRMLPARDLAETLSTDRPQDFIIAGVADLEDKTLLLYRGDLKPVMVPFSWFKKSGVSGPDFTDLEIIDHGLSIRLGNYEAATDIILDAFSK